MSQFKEHFNDVHCQLVHGLFCSLKLEKEKQCVIALNIYVKKKKMWMRMCDTLLTPPNVFVIRQKSHLCDSF